MDSSAVPPEILLCVMSFADKPTLKKLRQCCKWLRTVTTPILFEELVVVPYVSSFEGATKLSFNPGIRDAVKRIRYEVNCLFDPSINLDDPSKNSAFNSYRQQLQVVNYKYPGFVEYFDKLQDECFHPPGPGDLENTLYVSSNGWIMSTAGSETNAISYLPYFFPNVEEIDLTSKGWTPNDPDIVDEPVRPLPHFYQRWFRAHKRDRKAPDLSLRSGWFSNGGADVISYRVQCLLLAITNHSNRRLRVKIEGLTGRAFGWTYSDEVTEIRTYDCMRKTPALHLNFYNEDEEGRLGDVYTGLAPLLANNRVMKDLSLDFHDAGEGPQRLLKQVILMNKPLPLEHLSLGHLSVDADTLIGALRHLSPTLRTLRLDTVRLRSKKRTPIAHNNWSYVFRTLAEEFNLEDVELVGTFRGDRQEFDMASSQRLHNDWHRRASSVYQDDPRAFVRQLLKADAGASDIRRLFFNPGTNDIMLYDEENCLSARVRRYIIKQGPCPEELEHFDAFARQSSLSEVIGNSRPLGDYSMRMRVGY